MGVCIDKCNKDSEKIINSSIVYNKKTEQSNYNNLNTSNIFNEQERNLTKMKFKKIFSKKNSNKNNETISPFIHQKMQEYASIKIQKFYRNYIKLKNEKEIEREKLLQKEKEESPFLKMNLDMVETGFSSNSLINSNISKENINNNDKTIMKNNTIPFNIKNKLSNMHCKYSGYLKKISKSNKTNNEGNNLNSDEEKVIFDNEESLIKEGFGKFIFNDGTEFIGIFHNNIFQNYGKYLHINHKDNQNKNFTKSESKEIIITDTNLNYEEFVGEYKNYTPNGFGIYTNLITNLKITGIFGQYGLYGIGIEKSVEGGYTYYGEFKNNKKEGLGTIEWNDGSKYQGEFTNNHMNGYGMIEFPDKNFYQGEIKNGKMDGFGEFFWGHTKKYVGYYKNDKRNGFGIYISKTNDHLSDSEFDNEYDYHNCSTFIGFWKNGNMDGFGMTVYNSEIKYGIWENGFKKKCLQNNGSLKSYAKWMNKNFNRLFLKNKSNVLEFLETICNIKNELNNSEYMNNS